MQQNHCFNCLYLVLLKVEINNVEKTPAFVVFECGSIGPIVWGRANHGSLKFGSGNDYL
jgi:hypothetical protein